MLALRSITLREGAPATRFPFSVPAIRSLETLTFPAPVTFLVGENGSGKSTFLEALAWAVKAVAVGSTSLDTDETLAHARELGSHLELTWNRRSGRGFFLRAEDFFGFVKNVNREQAGLADTARRLRADNPHLHEGELDRIASPYEGSAEALRDRYGEDMDARSHGEQFLAFFQARLAPGGLYLLDEPEVPLSPSRQLALLSMLKEASTGDGASQFIVATHSPILMALPGATILSFDHAPVERVAYEDLEHVKLTRDFLNRPEAFLRHL